MKKFSYLIIFAFTFCQEGNRALAQYCIPPTTCTNCFGFGITKVTFNTINNNSSNASSGYQDFTSIQTSVTVGQSYLLTVKADVPDTHHIKAWIDWNNDFIFDDVNEVVLAVNKALNCTSSVYIPPNALLGPPLRLRISANYHFEAIPTPCDSINYGQAEDYTVIVQQNTSPPVADFSADNAISCNGVVNFTDNSTNIPTQWLWDFGDSGFATIQNPQHIYSSDGTYSVTLIAINSYGSDTLIKNNFIAINLAQQLPPVSCIPVTTDTSINCGIYSVSFNTISNTSDGNIDSYQDYSCTKNTTITEGMQYNVSINTGPINSEDIRIWMDLNGDGELNDTAEKIFTSLNSKVHTGLITIPAATSFGIPLRMRITSESTGNPITSCSNPLFGQTEDYGVTIVQFTGAPTADFSADNNITCSGTINFNDLSYGLPTSWNWNFGDGTTSSLQNPTHTYSSPGTYSVTLAVASQYGNDSIIKTNYISYYQKPQSTNCTSETMNYCCGMGIYSVQINTINNNTSDGGDGYKDYSCTQQTTLAANQSYNINVVTGNDNAENVRVWIDFNNSGSLNNNNEKVFSSDNVFTFHNGNIFIPSSAVTGIPLRMRVSSDYDGNQPPLPCQDVQYGQAEDYTVIIVNPTNAPVSNFTVDSPNTCTGAVNFTDQSTNTPTSWLWNFGDGNTSNLKNPQHTYVNNGAYTVSLTATNPIGNDSKTKNNYITKSNSFCGVGEEEIEIQEPGTRIFPNPNGGKFLISNFKYQIKKIEIYNVIGELVFRKDYSQNSLSRHKDAGKESLDISNHPAGIYFLQISDGEKIYSTKLVVEK